MSTGPGAVFLYILDAFVAGGAGIFLYALWRVARRSSL
jgi:hypothetical protein